jgi:hypothetical protein
MNAYSIALFLHVVGALLLFVAMTLEGVALRQISRAVTVDQARPAFAIPRLNRVIGPISLVTILIPGLYMMNSSGGWRAWSLIGLITWAVIAVLGTASGIRLVRLERSLAGAGLIPPAVRMRLAAPAYAISWRVRVGLATGVVYLMTVKPGVAGALIAVVVAALIGLGTGIPALRRGQPAEVAAS